MLSHIKSHFAYSSRVFIHQVTQLFLGDFLDIFTPDILSGKLKEIVGHFQNLQVLSGRQAVFAKTALGAYFQSCSKVYLFKEKSSLNYHQTLILFRLLDINNAQNTYLVTSKIDKVECKGQGNDHEESTDGATKFSVLCLLNRLHTVETFKHLLFL